MLSPHHSYIAQPTRVLLWSLVPLAALPIVYVALNSGSGSTDDNVRKAPPLLVLYAFVWIWHVVFGIRSFRSLLLHGWDWRLLLAGLFSILGTCFWPLVGLLTISLSGI